MKTEYQTIAVFGKRGNPSIEALNRIRLLLLELGKTVLLERSTAEALGLSSGYELEEIGELADLVIVLGGDGTMLGISRRMARFKIPFIGINAGNLGFITDIGAEDYETPLREIFEGKYYLDSRLMVQAELIRGEETVAHHIALNDVVISRGISGKMIEFSVSVDGQHMSVQRSDGIIVATPTGSTAYATSVGGPLVHPTIQGLLMLPVAPHTLTNRPIMIPDSSVIEITVSNIEDGALYFDMQDVFPVEKGDRIVIRKYPHTVHFIHPKGHNFYDTLRKKLHWNYLPSSCPSDNE
jgi:NAD+ kinase